eukprot:3699583-Alexandrium_andersonii.AAC.1
MSASLVGSEMCIRDRALSAGALRPATSARVPLSSPFPPARLARKHWRPCLLYTSDAADDM